MRPANALLPWVALSSVLRQQNGVCLSVPRASLIHTNKQLLGVENQLQPQPPHLDPHRHGELDSPTRRTGTLPCYAPGPPPHTRGLGALHSPGMPCMATGCSASKSEGPQCPYLP